MIGTLSSVMMKTLNVDVAVIGGGSAGLNARRAAARNGAKVVMIEGGKFGTTCARVGCMPSKCLIAAAEAAEGIRHAPIFGVTSSSCEPKVDGKAVMARMQKLRNRFVGGVLKSMDSQIPDEQIVRGFARFVGPTTLMVDEHTKIESKSVVIAAGTTPWIPPPFNDLGDRVITSDEVFEMEELPQSLAVLGTGIIGLELGQSFHRLGVRTMFFDIVKTVGPLRDPELIPLVKKEFEKELDLRLGIKFLSANRVDTGGVEIVYQTEDGVQHKEHVERVLATTGRRPNFPKLDLKASGLSLDARGVPQGFDERTCQLGDAPIFLAGDITMQRPLLHEAADEGNIAGENAAIFPIVRAHERRVPLHIVFSDPQICSLGKTPPHLAIGEGKYDYGEASFEGQGRALVMGQNRGRIRVYGNLCGHVVGAEMFGPDVEHLGHLVSWVSQLRLKTSEILELPFYHPVLEEALRTALRDLAQKIKVLPKPENMDCGPGT